MDNYVYFRDFQMQPPSKNEHLMLVSVKYPNSACLKYCTCVYDEEKNSYFELPLNDSLTKIDSQCIVGWMPLRELEKIEIDRSWGDLMEFIEHYSYGKTAYFRFTIEKQKYECTSYSNFLFNYGQLKENLLKQYNVVNYSIENNIVGRIPIYCLKLRKKKKNSK